MILPARPQPLLKIVLLFTLFMLIVIGCSMFLGYQTWAAYAVPAILLLLTHLIYKKEGKGLAALGLDFKGRHLRWLPIGLATGIAFLTAVLCMQLFTEGRSIQHNAAANTWKALAAIFLFIAGVLNEELIFRGYCLQHLVARIGFWKANLAAAFLFMVWHWFSWDAWGNMAVMVLSVTTAFGHLVFALALYRKGTLYFSIGLHLGINWASYGLFIMEESNMRADGLFLVVGSSAHAPAPLALAITLVFYLILLLFLWSPRMVLGTKQKEAINK